MHNSGFISNQNRSGQVEKERKKNYPSDPSYTTLNRKFQKNSKTPFKHDFKPKQVEKEGKKKISFLTDLE